MTPAAECVRCDYKVKTANEPAPTKQMERLIGAAVVHAAKAGAPLASLVPIEGTTAHIARFKYFETTPTDGSFDKAETVKG